MMSRCDSCHKEKRDVTTAVVNRVYYRHICRSCLGYVEVSSNAASYDRRRGYEDYAHETIQPYDASGPNPEFARLYPTAAAKVYPKHVLDDLKRKM